MLQGNHLLKLWEKKADPSSPSPTPSPEPSPSETKQHSITFNLNGSSEGTTPQPQTIENGKSIAKPTESPTRSGYTFKYWSTETSGSEYDFSTPVTSSFTLYAVWEKIKIYTIQGTTHESPFKDQTVTAVPGIVTAITYSKGAPTGFYTQDAQGDGNPATSDGIYVYCGKDNMSAALKVGDAVTVSGKIVEYIPNPKTNKQGNPVYDKADRLSTTQLMSDTSKIEIKSHDNTLPTAFELTPADMIKEVATGPIGTLEPTVEAIDFYESLEGMLVKVTNPQVIAKNFSKTYYIAPHDAPGISYRDGMMYNSYNATAMIPVYTTGCFAAEADSGYTKEGTDIGDSFNGDITGVITYHNGDYACEYQIALTEKLPALNKGSLEQESSDSIQFDEHKLNVVSYNLKNFSAGNNPDKKRAEQFAKHFISELKAPDIICLIEIQDDTGKKDNGTISSEQTLQLLLDKMTGIDPGKPYDKLYINPEDGVDGGQPGSNIRCAYLYRTDRVERVPDEDGVFTGVNASNTEAKIAANGMKLKENPARIGTTQGAFGEPFYHCRKSLVAHFKFKDGINGGKDFFMINNHFSSKRGDAPIWGAQQPVERKSEVNRRKQAEIVKNFIDSILDARPKAMIVSVGDYNDFWFSKTLEIMKGSNMKNAIEALPENERYTFVYNAHSQTLDNILVPNRSEVAISGANVLNVNSEFGGKLSDHDPVFVQLDW